MKKVVVCEKCWGSGYAQQALYDENDTCCGAISQRCDLCGGNGFISLEATEYDRIMDMSLDELAQFLFRYAHKMDRPLNVEEVKQYLSGNAIEKETSTD